MITGSIEWGMINKWLSRAIYLLVLLLNPLQTQAVQTRETCTNAIHNVQYREVACHFAAYAYLDDRQGSDFRPLKLVRGEYLAPVNPAKRLSHFANLTLGDLHQIPLFDEQLQVEVSRTLKLTAFETRDRYWLKVPEIDNQPVGEFFKVFAHLKLTPMPLRMSGGGIPPDSPGFLAQDYPGTGAGIAFNYDLLPGVADGTYFELASHTARLLDLLSFARPDSPALGAEYNNVLTVLEFCQQFRSPFLDPVPVKISCEFYDVTKLKQWLFSAES